MDAKEKKFEGQAGESLVDLENARGKNKESHTKILCFTVLTAIAFMVIGSLLALAIYRDTDIKRDYVTGLLPILTALIGGYAGYFISQRSQRD